MRPALALVLALGAAALPVRAAARPARPARPADTELLEVPVRVLVARCAAEGAGPGASQPASAPAPVRPPEWLAAHLAGAARVLAPHRVALRPQIEEFTPERCDLVGREQRDLIAHHVRPGEVTVVVVRRVPDLAKPDYDLMGVDWSYGGAEPALRGRRYVLLTARARPPVVAHELGHRFGLPHDRRGGNLMTPGPSDRAWRRRRAPRPMQERLTPAQAARLRAGVRAYLARPPAASQPARRGRT